MDDILIVAIFLFISLLIIALSYGKWEIQVFDAILGIVLSLEFMDLNFPVGLFVFGLSLWILFEGLKEAS